MTKPKASPKVPPLVGLYEASEILGITRHRVSYLATTHRQFPTPVAYLRCGPVWLEDEIAEFAKVPRPQGRPRKTPVDGEAVA